MKPALDYASLKARHRAERDAYPQGLSLRIHRSLSWLDRAERETQDNDARFVFLWIAFNAAYAAELNERSTFSEVHLFNNFLRRLLAADKDGLIYSAIWERFPGPVRLLLDNKYVFRPFWDWKNGRIDEAYWMTQFATSREKVHQALARGRSWKVLSIVLDRLYVLRNQLVHGGATWNGGINRDQVRDGAAIMGFLVPTIIHLMMGMTEHEWPQACYPVVD